MKPFLILLSILLPGSLLAGITVDPTCSVDDISIDTLEVGGVTYNYLTVDDLDRIPFGDQAGVPCLPFRVRHFVLPPSYCIDDFSFISFTWDTLPGQYYIYPAQTQDMEDSTFTLPDSEIYELHNSDQIYHPFRSYVSTYSGANLPLIPELSFH